MRLNQIDDNIRAGQGTTTSTPSTARPSTGLLGLGRYGVTAADRTAGTQQGQRYGTASPDSPLPDWTPDMSRYPEPRQPEGGILYDTSFLQGGAPGGTFQGGVPTDINYDELGPYTREVGEDETVRNQIEGLLGGDSVYMDQARQAGERAAAARGALSSSMFAGASQSAAIQAALPIAAQDAQTYSRVASENAAAINNNTLSKMQSMTQLAAQTIGAQAQIQSASIGSAAQIQASKIAAQTNMEVSKMRIESEQDARQFMAAHDQIMSSIQHGQTIELQNLDYGFRTRLAQAGFNHDINMSLLNHEQQQQILDLSHEYALEQIGYQGSVNDYLQDQQLRAGFLQTGMGNLFAFHNTISQMGLDEAGYRSAASRGQQLFNDFMGMFNDLYGGDGFNFGTPIQPEGPTQP